MKKIFKLGALFIVLGVCTFYTYQFICYHVKLDSKNGKKIMSSEAATASLDKPDTKKFYFEKLKPKEKLEVDLIYIMQDKYLKKGYYYFIDVLPWSVYPQSKEEIGIFKLPLGIEGK